MRQQSTKGNEQQRMKTLILSCNTGQGHNSCAQALQKYYQQQGDICDIADALEFISESFSRFLSWGHVTMYRHFPRLFRIGYRYSEKHPALFREKSGIYKLLTLGTERIYQYILSGGYDCVICTHVFSGLMMTDVLKKHPMTIATCLLATDYTCSPCVKDSTMDLYFIPSPSLSCDFECATIRDSQLRSVGIPLRQDFYQAVDKASAKKHFQVPETHTHLLIMCGSMGCGPIQKLAQGLSGKVAHDVDISIVCGTNRRLEKKLRRKFAGNARMHIWGYVQEMSLLMDAADLCLTKPGGISVTEAALKNLPMVLIDAVAGCEEFNRIFYVRNGGAKTGENSRELEKLTLELLSRPEQLDRMRSRLGELPKGNACALIYRQMKELLEKKVYENCPSGC